MTVYKKLINSLEEAKDRSKLVNGCTDPRFRVYANGAEEEPVEVSSKSE